MPDYRRAFRPGGTFFLTIVTHRRRPLFGDPANVVRLRESLRAVMAERPFDIDAGVVLPDCLHIISRRFVAGDAVADVGAGGWHRLVLQPVVLLNRLEMEKVTSKPFLAGRRRVEWNFRRVENHIRPFKPFF